MKNIIIVALCCIALISCGEPERFNKDGSLFEREERHDKVPLMILGTWASSKDKHTPVLTVTETYIMNDNL